MVITNGCKPVTVSVSSFNGKGAYVFNVDVARLSQEKVIDTNAAGDSFVGGFLAKIAEFEYSKYLELEQPKRCFT